MREGPTATVEQEEEGVLAEFLAEFSKSQHSLLILSGTISPFQVALPLSPSTPSNLVFFILVAGGRALLSN